MKTYQKPSVKKAICPVCGIALRHVYDAWGDCDRDKFMANTSGLKYRDGCYWAK